MRWVGRRASANVEDRRGRRGRGVAVGGIGGIVVVLLALLLGVDPRPLLEQDGTVGLGIDSAQYVNPAQEQLRDFTAVVLADTEDVWHELFRAELGTPYREPKLVLFSGDVRSACGLASAAVGPFYCPADTKVYLDLQFFDELQRRFGAAGDFAQAYVIAHEVGHHVQNQLGILRQLHAQRGQVSKAEHNRLSVRSELQADFLAGVWAHHAQRTKSILEPGDVEEALRAAAAIGDDRLQKQAQGYVVPDSFTHGTSEQRVRWFRLGFESGDLSRLMEPFELDYGDL